MTTRKRKKGCPFCKSSPDRCCLEIDRRVGTGTILCLECGARGPEASMFNEVWLGTDSVWEKWNKRD